MHRCIAAALLVFIASVHAAMAQPPPPEALQECQDFTFALRTQREQLADAAAAAHSRMTQLGRQMAALQQENAALKAELAKLKAAAPKAD